MRLWRLCPTRHVGTAFTGMGAKLGGGRWNDVGTSAVYLSAHLSLCALEVLVHADAGDLPEHAAIPVEVPDVVSIELLDDPASVTDRWRDDLSPPELRAFGDTWVLEGRSLLLRVPSVIIPEEHNYVLNPAHPDFEQLVVGTAVPFSFDPRLSKG